MRTRMVFAAAALAASLGLASGDAAAASPRLEALRESAHELAERTKAIRVAATRVGPEVRKESERIVSVVDAQRTAVEGRIAVVELAAPAPEVERAAVDEMEDALEGASRLLATVEAWYRPAR